MSAATLEMWRSRLQSLELGEKQIMELCDTVGKLLALELTSEAIRMKVKRVVVDYLNKRDIADDPERLLKKLEWAVRVKIAR
jgi:hypothetical protein